MGSAYAGDMILERKVWEVKTFVDKSSRLTLRRVSVVVLLDAYSKQMRCVRTKNNPSARYLPKLISWACFSSIPSSLEIHPDHNPRLTAPSLSSMHLALASGVLVFDR